jgi:hypothetical protein
MADHRAKELIDFGNRLFTKRDPMLTLWQEISEHFFVERADFTDSYIAGEDFARHLENSYPNLLRRELGNSISAMLRPRDRQWFKLTTLDEDMDEEPTNAAYLDYVTEKMRRMMYDTNTKLVRATKEVDHDFVTFGQGVMSIEENEERDGLFYRSYHLRDCAWIENSKGEVDHLHRRDKMSARQMAKKFGESNLDKTVKSALKRDPSKEFNIRVCCMPADEYDLVGKGKDRKLARPGTRIKYVVIYVDADNCKVLRESRYAEFPFIVPRWQTISGFQYAYSPCTSIALPDARMIQQMSRIILEAGEKSVDPPVVAVEEAVREVNLAAGGITWADFSFDGKLREAVQPIQIENNMQVAFSMQQDMRELMQKAWFLDKLHFPQPEGAEQMTAREVSVRQQEFIRNLLPLFEPIEVEYNSKLLDKTYSLMRNMKMFPAEEVPETLAGAEVQWRFESPLQEGQQRIKTSQFMETLELIGAAAQMGLPAPPIDLQTALMDAIRGTSAPGDWFKPDEQIEAEAQQGQQMEQMAQQLGMAQEVLGTVQQGAEASKTLAEGQQMAAQGAAPGAAPGGGNLAPPPSVPALPPPTGA